MRPVGVVAAEILLRPGDPAVTSPEMVFEVAQRAVAASGIPRPNIGLTVSASSDMLEGRPFNFVKGLEALGAWPATRVHHVEMDGAWALYDAWIAIQAGEVDSALVVAWSVTSEADLSRVLNLQLDPFVLAPLGIDHVIGAALQADAFLARTKAAPRIMNEQALWARDAATRNETLSSFDGFAADAPWWSPLRTIHCPRYADGACAIVLAAAPALNGRTPLAWLRGADHRTETGSLGHRDLSRSPAATAAAARAFELAGWNPAEPMDVAEIGASFAHQVPLLTEALRAHRSVVNPSGGPLVADAIGASGLVRIAEAAVQVGGSAGSRQVPGARRAIAHASSGHALQQNAVFLLESGSAAAFAEGGDRS